MLAKKDASAVRDLRVRNAPSLSCHRLWNDGSVSVQKFELQSKHLPGGVKPLKEQVNGYCDIFDRLYHLISAALAQIDWFKAGLSVGNQ